MREILELLERDARLSRDTIATMTGVRAHRPGPTIRAVSDLVSRKLSTIDRVRATATHFVLKTYERDGDAFGAPEPDHRLPVTPWSRSTP